MPVLLGMLGWEGERDEIGHRTYRVQWLVSTALADGPSVLFAFTGTGNLPSIGDSWIFGNDNDSWARCWPNWKCTPVNVRGEPTDLWVVEQTFTTKPIQRCQTTTIEDPLSEPFRLSGTFVQYTREAVADMDGNAIRNSAFGRITGPEVEVDASRPTVRVGFNISTLPLATITSYLHQVNDSTLWGVAPRCVKFSNMTWQRNLYGTCTFYYSVDYDFDIRFETFDSNIHDFGTSELLPGGTEGTPDHYAASKDRRGENRLIPLNGHGRIWDGTGTHPSILVKFYKQANLLDLGIPSSF